jgi:DNA processing protein
MCEHMFDDFGGGHTVREEQAAVLALVARARSEWFLVSQLLEATGSARRIIEGNWTGFEPEELKDAITDEPVTDADLADYERLIAELESEGVWLLTVLDDAYPTNLRLIYNRPPFLFVRGTLLPQDDRAIAVVGTRKASDEGRAQADRLARGLVAGGVTVLSGLALGIDGTAHRAALDAGGRTVAVVGTGIRRTYPAEHVALARSIVDAGGAIVSQFWPDAPPTRWSFPMRNITMSGMGIGTVVVEASSTSGAKSQASRALDHGKRLFLVESLVMQEPWARKYAEKPNATVVTSVDEAIAALEADLHPARQLSLA